MSKTVTLGGDRLGSGKKMKVTMHGFERSTHDLGYLFRSTMSAGTLVPFMHELLLPADTFDINLECDIKTHPTVGPLFGSYKVQLDVFSVPIRLYNSWLHNNMLNIGRDISQIKFPQIRLLSYNNDFDPATQDVDNSQVNPSCLLAYLGIRGVGLNTSELDAAEREFNAMAILAYWDAYKNYYANKQEEIGAVIHDTTNYSPNTDIDEITVINPFITPAGENDIPLLPATGFVAVNTGYEISIQYTTTAPDPATIMVNILGIGWVQLITLSNAWDNIIVSTEVRGTYNGAYGNGITILSWRDINNSDSIKAAPNVATFSLANLDTMRNNILAKAGNLTFVLNDEEELEPYRWLYEAPLDRPYRLSSQEGLAVKTYQSDLFNNWIQTEWIDGAGGITEVTAIDTTGGSFSIDTLNLSRKVYDMLNRIAVSDGTYHAWLEVQYDHEPFQQVETPIYMGGLIKELVFQEVVSNAAAEGEGAAQPLGTLAGKGIMGRKHKGGKVVVKCNEPSILFGNVSLTPRIDYSQGNDWKVNLKTMGDLHVPMLDQIGFQDLITEQMAWWSTEWDNTNNEWVQLAAGKQPAWVNYMTNINRTYGNFAIASNEMFMTLNRRYEATANTAAIQDLTTYIDPVKFNYIFAQTSLDAQNFWCQIAVDITARRKMSGKLMPNL